MKLILIKSNLKDGLFVVERLVGDNQNLPILKNTLITVSQKNIQLIATNLETAVNYTVSGKVIEEGAITIPSTTLSTIISNLQTERLNLEATNTSLIITTDNYHATIQGSSANEFPIIPTIKNQKEHIEIKAELFTDALAQVVASAQFSDIRPELSSVLFDFSLDTLKLTTTDSFRLSEKTITKNNFSTIITTAFKILIPLKTTHELLRILKPSGLLRIYRDENQILFKTENIEFISRLIDGKFPEYTEIIPRSFSLEAVLNREELMNAVKLTSVFGSKTNEIKIKTTNNKKALEIFSTNQSIGENTYIIPAKIKGELKEVNFNWRYVLDGLKALTGAEVFLGINSDNKPALLRSPQEQGYFYILMPVIKN